MCHDFNSASVRNKKFGIKKVDAGQTSISNQMVTSEIRE